MRLIRLFSVVLIAVVALAATAMSTEFQATTPQPDITGAFGAADETAPAAVSELVEELASTRRLSSYAITTTRDRIPSGRDRVAVDIVKPDAPGCFPVVVLLHGSRPQRASKHYQAMAEDLARRGYVALYVHYYDRGRRGRGSRADWTRTISDSLTFAARLPAADGDRMGLVGYSLGAFLALTGAPVDPRVRAVVAFYGGLSGGDPAGLRRSMPPTLLLHGTADRIVPVRRSVQAFEALRAEGRVADLVVYPKARHGFCLNGRAGADGLATVDAWARTVAFLEHHLHCPPDSLAALVGACEPESDSGGQVLLATLAWNLTPAYLRPTMPAGGPSPLVNPSPDQVKACTVARHVKKKPHVSTRKAAARHTAKPIRVASGSPRSLAPARVPASPGRISTR